MDKSKSCDICGRSAQELRARAEGALVKIEKDADGLWVCSECGARLVSTPSEPVNEDELDEKIRALIGKNAGAICRTMNLPYLPPYQSIIDAASKIGYDEDRYMSTWAFVTQWLDGTTVWESEDRSAIALVRADGTVQVELTG